MKPGKGAVRLLLLVEVVLLAVVIVFGVVGRLHKTERESTSWSEPTETPGIASDELKTDEDATESEAAEVQTEQNFSAEVEEALAAMTLEEKAAQLFLTTPESLTQSEQVNIAGAGTRNAINEYPVGGLIYSGINYQGREQAGNLMFNAEEISYERIGLYLFLAVRMEAEDGTPMVGIADGHEPDALVEALAANRLSEEDANISLPIVFPAQQTKVTADSTWVMLTAAADVSVTGEENLPCALSAQCVEAVRAMGYEGVILTDSLSAENIKNTYSVGEAAVLAVKAGVDMVYCPENFPDAYRAVLEAVRAGEMEEEQINRAVGRILTQKYRMSMVTTEQEETGEDNGQQQVMEGGEVTGN